MFSKMKKSGSITRRATGFLLALSIMRSVAAIPPSNTFISDANTTVSTSATDSILHIIEPLQPFMESIRSHQNLTFVHPPVTLYQARHWSTSETSASAVEAPTARRTGLRRRAGVTNVMVVGDSITQGHEGDWTWRYRLWDWLVNDEGIDIEFVGPWVGTRPQDEPAPPVPPPLQDDPVDSLDDQDQIANGGYAAAAKDKFLENSDHFSAWGRQLAQANGLIRAQVSEWQPDYLLVLLGFNDVGWFISDAEGTFESMKIFINEAREAKPDIKMALANIPQRSYIGGRDDLPIKTDVYNQLLKSAIPWLSTEESQVELVELRENYDCDVGGCPAGYDGLHPNALGEYQIASAFSQALVNGFGVGAKALAVPEPGNIPVRPNAIPTNIQAISSDQGITVTWDSVYGARGYDIHSSLEGQPWVLSQTGTTRYDTSWVLDGWKYEFKIRTNNGNDAYDTTTAWSAPVSAVTHPKTPGPPTGVTSLATATGVDVSWGAIAGVTEWVIFVLDTDTSGAYIRYVGIDGSRLSGHVDDLAPGTHYLIAVQGWNQYGGGFPAVGYSITCGAGTPPAPTNLQVTSLDPTTVQLDWCGSAAAAGYHLWSRNVNAAGSVLTTDDSVTGATTNDWYFLFPGVWNYEFCVSAINGNLSSEISNCETAGQVGTVVGGPVGGSDCYQGPRTFPVDGWRNPTPSCIGGTGPGNHEDLCVLTCSLGFCPQPCICTAEGPQATLPTSTNAIEYPVAGGDCSYIALCSYACSLGYCPVSVCSSTSIEGPAFQVQEPV